MAFSDLFDRVAKRGMTAKQAARILGTTPEALAAFEAHYKTNALSKPDASDAFGVSARQAKADADRITGASPDMEAICVRIVDELLSQTEILDFDGRTCRKTPGIPPHQPPVAKDELDTIPFEVRPMLTGSLAMTDMPFQTSYHLLNLYAKHLDAKDPAAKQMFYHQFRQGLDILDLDPISYAMLGMNQNAIGYWLPAVAETAVSQGFFKVPKTTVIKVPLTLLQLSRLEYSSINATTRKIVDDYCMSAFRLDPAYDYFVKTGTYSSKFDFRNAHVTAGKEVAELGEYLLYISSRAVELAGPLTQPSVYGMSTTNEWCVREYVHDVENNPCIYKGMPLRTEYRAFVDFDSGAVLAVAPYWDAKLMKRRFAQGARNGNVHDAHDYVIYEMHEPTLTARFDENAEAVAEACRKLAEAVRDAHGLTGQWSIDIMQNGGDFWLIDMAWAQQSALYEYVPEELRIESAEKWLPAIGE